MTWVRRHRWLTGACVVLLVLIVVIVTIPFWIRPVVEAKASTALGRPVTIGRLGMAFAWPPRVTADDVIVGKPTDVANAPDLATIKQLTVTLDLWPLARFQMLTIPEIDIAGIELTAERAPDGSSNYALAPVESTGSSWTTPSIGVVRITDSHAHISVPDHKSEVEIALHTEDGTEPTIVGDVSGTYEAQKVTGKLIGGALLGLRDPGQPYPVDVHLSNGQSRLDLQGTIRDPFGKHTADLKLRLAGQDMESLYPLTGIPFPPTPPFDLASTVDYEGRLIHLQGIVGRLGSSDMAGTLDIDTGPKRPIVSGNIHSKQADLQDLAGFIGSQPGRATTPGQTAEQKAAVAKAVASPRLLPNLAIDFPKIHSADFHIVYRGDKIIGRSVPFDSIATRLDIDDGHIKVTDFRLGVGRGQVLGQVDMTPVAEGMRTSADFKFQRLDVARLLQATHIVHGDGVLGGELRVESVGKSFAGILGRGNGRLTLSMAGGNVSALIVDLSGLQIGNALLSALGLPERADIRCLIGDMTLKGGLLETGTLLLDTTSDRTTLHGTVNLRDEAIAAQLRTTPKHFTIGSLPAPFAITGTLKDPNFAPDVLQAGGRTAAAVGLGILFPPLALLPTIQFGIGEDNACVSLVKSGPSAPVERAAK